MTLEQYISNLEAKIKKLQDPSLLKKAVLDAQAEMTTRIFDKGENTTGDTFDYSKGYKGFRSKKGRQNKFVDFRLTGNLRSDFRKSPKKISNTVFNLEINRPENQKKVFSLDDRYNIVFEINKEEVEHFEETLRKEILLILNG
jgi:hypothetical protein